MNAAIACVVMMLGASSGKSAEGVGRPRPDMPAAQSRLMARRAAEIVAVRNLGRGGTGQLKSTPSGRQTWPFRHGRVSYAGTVRHFEVTSVRNLPDGRVVVRVAHRR